MERFQFDEAFKSIRLAWDVLADHYIELQGQAIRPGRAEKKAAQATYTGYYTLARLRPPSHRLSPRDLLRLARFVHQQSWPEVQELALQGALKGPGRGDSAVGGEEMALNVPLSGLEIYTDMDIETDP